MSEHLESSQADTLMQQLERQIPVNRSESARMAHVQPYAFKREEAPAIQAGSIPFERLHQTLLGEMRTLVYDITRQKPAVLLEPLPAKTFHQWREQWHEPCQLHLIKMEPLGISLVIALESDLVCGLVDLIFGGDGTPPKRARRKTFSHSEAQVAGKFLDRMLQMLDTGWADVLPVAFKRKRMEIQPQFANFVPDDDAYCGFRFALTLGVGQCGVNVLFPAAALNELQARFQPDAAGNETGGANGTAGVWEHHIRRKLEDAQVEMVAELASVQLTIEEVLSLQRGDIIPIPALSGLQIRVGEKPVFACGFGISQGRHAVRVDQRLAGLSEWANENTIAEGVTPQHNQTGERA